MTHYLLAVCVILLANLVPAFAPPTWAILVFFTLHQDVSPVALVILGVLSATTGRAILATSFRKLRDWLPKGYVSNMETLGVYVAKNSRRAMGLLALFFLSPISSAQLFEAAGIIKEIKLKPLLLAFACGRLVSYSIYVSGATALKATSLGQVLKEEITSPVAILIQIALILGLVALGNVKWKVQE
ncbi:MAG TPA: hypothetical protein VF307_06530 [Candidatus Nanopelagicaceae bacterium]